jgi:hypothetical protein
MKYTQEQIEAALAYAEYKETNDTLLVLYECIPEKPRQGFHMATRCNIILAGSYRELQEENKRLKPWSDLAISSNALLEIERFERACRVARKEKP